VDQEAVTMVTARVSSPVTRCLELPEAYQALWVGSYYVPCLAAPLYLFGKVEWCVRKVM